MTFDAVKDEKVDEMLSKVNPIEIDIQNADKDKFANKAWIRFAVINLNHEPFVSMPLGPWNNRPLNTDEATKLLQSIQEEGILSHQRRP
jgi:hypothetical protein